MLWGDEERSEEPHVLAHERGREADQSPLGGRHPEAVGIVLEQVRMLADEHILRQPGRLESVTFVEILDGTPKNRVGGRQVCLDRGTDLHVHVLPNGRIRPV